MAGCYQEYEKEVVDACVRLMGEENRGLWEGADFRDAFSLGLSPEDVVRSVFGIEHYSTIASARYGQVDGTLNDALCWSVAWAEADSGKRLVVLHRRYLDELNRIHGKGI